MKVDSTITLKELIELATPFDETSHSREVFLRKITPELEKQFSESYTKEFEESIQSKGIYFIVNFSKTKRFGYKPTIKLSICGKEKLPTISLNC